MSQSRNILIEHQSLIDFGKALGYFKQDDSCDTSQYNQGICFGVGHMAMQAILSHDIASFNNRLELMSQFTPKQLAKKIEAVKDKYKQGGSFANHKANDEDLKFLEILSFFDGVQLYQSAYLYPELFPELVSIFTQDAEKVWHLTLSKALEKTGGLVHILKNNKISGIYTKKELLDYLKSLKKIAKNLKHPVCFELSSGHHAILLGYDPEKKFLFVDANYLPIREQVKLKSASKQWSLNELVDWVHEGFSKNNYAAFSTKIYTAEVECQSVERELIKLLDGDERSWQHIHSVTKEKAGQVDSYGISLLYIAACQGHLDVVKALIAAGANLNQQADKGISSLFIAAQQGHLDVVNALIAAGADVFLNREDGCSPLVMAVQMGHIEVVKLLIAAGADVSLALTDILSSIDSDKLNDIFQVFKENIDVNFMELLDVSSVKQQKALKKCLILLLMEKNLEKFKERWQDFSRLQKLAEEFFKMNLTYHSSNKNRKTEKNNLINAVDEAFQAYVAEGDIDEIIVTLKAKARDIAKRVADNHAKSSWFFFGGWGTKSRLSRNIYRVIEHPQFKIN